MKQTTFASLAYAGKKKRTRREKFLAEMEAVVPWPRLVALIEPHYPKAGPKGGRPPMPLEVMLRVYCLQQWYALSDPAAEEALYDSDAMRRFAGLELGEDAIPDETTILNFRHLLERQELTRAIFEAVNAYLRERGILLREGTLVDATLIDAPSSTKNKQRARDPEMTSTKKGNAWYFGSEEDQERPQWGVSPTNAHVGVDLDSGVVHSLEASTAKVHDSQKFDDLLHGDENAVFGELPGLRHRFEQPLATAMSAASGRRRSASRARSGE
jgi:transposase, IS5 family